MYGWYKGYLYKLLLMQVMAISVISVSYSSEDSVGTPAGRVILFGTIPTTIPDTTLSVIPPTTYIDTTSIPTVSPTIPPSPDYTPASPDYSPAFDTKFDPSEDPSSNHIPPLPATSPFLSSTDDSLDCDTPPSPTHGTPFTETTLSTQSSLVVFGALQRRVMILSPGQPIPHGRPYRYHLNRLVHMMTARKRFGPLPTHRLDVRHSVDYSSSDHFSSDDSSRDSSSSSSSVPSHDSSSASHSRKRNRSPDASVPLSSPTLRALSYARVDLSPSPKRIRSLESATDLEGCSEDSFEPYVPRETGLGVDFVDESSKPSRFRGTNLDMDVDVVRSNGIDIDPEIQAEIDECFAYTDALRDRGIDARVVVEAIDQEEIEMGVRGLVEVRVDKVTHPMIVEDIPEPAQEGVVIESVQRDQGHRIVATGQQSNDMLERIQELERDNMRLRDMMDVARTDDPPPYERRGWSKELNGDEMEIGKCTYQDFLKCQPLSFNGTKGVVGLTHWFEKMETWTSHKRTIAIEAAYAISWAELIKLITEVYCLINEVQKMETELWKLAVKGNDLTAYTRRFQELVLLCTRMVPNEEEKLRDSLEVFLTIFREM
ncbi:hypothetical protein Tco_0499644 [Tanacetum coccineum]